ncbi:MaoC/PaaZ C-terminal domain-containing protein [Hydrogenophaga sp. 2FB]|uniref:MaoC/PaaZ C-terminal domain-containing protein n=1 Tax=Hydrogenophaga sp. 2FB TaxID=2502187 RepID=UPI00207BCC09|nr:MaoC/PaaZ C-terminal domain-containing protein [Hydrogenophaga sp. 2FB]
MLTSTEPRASDMIDEATPLQRGRHADQLEPGQRFKTIRRTITETDLVNFIGLSGLFVEGFLNEAPSTSVLKVKGRAVPGALTYAMVEGMVIPGLLAGTGLALLESHQVMHKPVQVGDTIQAVVEIVEVRPTREVARAIVTSRISIVNQHGTCVITYETKRLLSMRSTP